ncbi:MAG: nitroreductase family protein [Deltaproteobacteria bacterium]|nr:nitroreductase family protein [Deltaproteobacteria bacterium]
MIDFGELRKLIRTRRSIRKFQDKPVSDELLLRALELAVWAPNGGNHQGWRFLVVTNRDLIGKMADAVRTKSELLASWPEARQFGGGVERWRRNSDFFRAAPACIAVLMSAYSSIADQILLARGEGDPVAREIQFHRRMGSSSLQSVAAAVATLLLVLHHFGLGATWMAGPLQAKKEIEQLLQVPPEWNFVDLIPVGYPAESPPPPPRKAAAEVVQFLR